MSVSFFVAPPRLRRGIALCAVVLATGGLVLYRSPAGASPGAHQALTAGKNSAAFSGPGAHGMVSLSHAHVLSAGETTVFADVRVASDDRAGSRERAPIALAVVLDTSGSMRGEKMDEARRSVLRLLGEMRDDDEITVVRYSDRSELIQPLARVASVRHDLVRRIERLEADGGTNIPSGMSAGLAALEASAAGRVRRMVLVSDGLDSTRAQAEGVARTSFASGITVSSLGIGVDFDESYMGSLAQNGHGNFAFVKDGAALATFLHRELVETATTTVENMRVRLRLPAGVRLVSATGADVVGTGSDVELVMGSLFAGDERRVVVELAVNPRSESGLEIETEASFCPVGGQQLTVHAPRLTLLATNDPAQVESGQDGAVLASATSVVASRRQVAASNAYAQGDVALAAKITEENQERLVRARAAAPPRAAAALESQLDAYTEMKRSFRNVDPSSVAGKAAAKEGSARDQKNLGRSTF